MNPDRSSLLAAVQGPVLTIAVGSLFALDEYTSLHFGQTWPLILIVLGVLNLGRWAAFRESGRASSRRQP